MGGVGGVGGRGGGVAGVGRRVGVGGLDLHLGFMLVSPSSPAGGAILPDLGFIIPGPIHFWAALSVNSAGLNQDPKWWL